MFGGKKRTLWLQLKVNWNYYGIDETKTNNSNNNQTDENDEIETNRIQWW